MKRKQPGLVPRARKVGAKADPVVSVRPLYGDARDNGAVVGKERATMADKKQAGGQAVAEKTGEVKAQVNIRELKRQVARAGRIYQMFSAARARIAQLEDESQLYKIINGACAEIGDAIVAREKMLADAQQRKAITRETKGIARVQRTLGAMAKQRARLVKVGAANETLAAFDDAAIRLMLESEIKGTFPGDYEGTREAI
jgi:hypothetical protein